LGLYFANGFLINEIPGLQNPDEIIPMRSIQHMAQTHKLDTDWAHADLWEGFQRVHFNFSGYLLAAYAYTSGADPGAIAMDGPLLSVLRQFSAVSTLALLALTFLLIRPLWGAGYAMLAALAVLLAPLTFQDAHYARPESLGALIFTACFLVAAQDAGSIARDTSRTLLICVMCGFLVSIKVTYAPAMLFAVSLMASHVSGNAATWRRILFVVAAGAGAFLAGAGLGAPYALMHPAAYLDGLHALQAQYAGFHAPHSLQRYSIGQQTSWIFAYFLSTIGAAALLLHPMGYLNPRGRAAMLAFFAIAGITVAFFACQHVFFERNLSHLLPCFMIIAVGGIRSAANLAMSSRTAGRPSFNAGSVVLTALLFVLMVKTSFGMVRELRDVFSTESVQAEREVIDAHVQRVANRIGAIHVIEVSYPQVIAGDLSAATECTVYKVSTYGDDWSRQFMTSVSESTKIDHIQRSRFADVPTSTLHTYHSPTIYLMHNPDLCQDNPA
jgi:hypothetical protein